MYVKDIAVGDSAYVHPEVVKEVRGGDLYVNGLVVAQPQRTTMATLRLTRETEGLVVHLRGKKLQPTVDRLVYGNLLRQYVRVIRIDQG